MIIDIVIGLVLAAAVVTGAIAGLVRQMGTLVAFVVAVLACRFFGGDIAAAVAGSGSEHTQLLSVLCYVLVFIIAFLIVTVIAKLLHATVSALRLGAVNRILGAVFRLGLWLVLMSACANIYFAVVPADKARFEQPGKPWRAWVVKAAPAVVGYIGEQSNT